MCINLYNVYIYLRRLGTCVWVNCLFIGNLVTAFLCTICSLGYAGREDDFTVVSAHCTCIFIKFSHW